MVDQLKDKLKKLEGDLATLNPQKNHEPADHNDKQENPMSGLKYIAIISVEILSGAAVGGFLGYYCDKFFATKPLCFIIFMILGIAGGFLNILKRFK